MTTAVIIERPRPIAGMVGFGIGALSLILVLVHFWTGPFAPQQEVTVSIGEIAADIRQSATRALLGQPQPEPVAAPWDMDRVLGAVTAALAGLAIILGLVGMVRRETRRPAGAAIVLGTSAVVIQLFIWTILILVGCILLYAIIGNIGEILGG